MPRCAVTRPSDDRGIRWAEWNSWRGEESLRCADHDNKNHSQYGSAAARLRRRSKVSRMLKRVLFQVHLWLGLTAGIVLAVVGVTGAALSYEDEILRWLNPGVMTVAPRADPILAPPALAAALAAREPGRRITAITVSGEPTHAARVIFAPAAGGAGRRGELRHVDPYTAELLGEPVGEDFFRLVMQLHRWLAAGAVGK